MDIRAVRKSLGLSQVELATLLGVTQATVSRLESKPDKVDVRTRLAIEAIQMRQAA